jgi:hypothetical protein
MKIRLFIPNWVTRAFPLVLVALILVPGPVSPDSGVVVAPESPQAPTTDPGHLPPESELGQVQPGPGLQTAPLPLVSHSGPARLPGPETGPPAIPNAMTSAKMAKKRILVFMLMLLS